MQGSASIQAAADAQPPLKRPLRRLHVSHVPAFFFGWASRESLNFPMAALRHRSLPASEQSTSI